MGGGGADPDPGQVGIQLQVQPWPPSLHPAQNQMLHRVEADGPQPDGVPYGCVHFLLREGFQQPEHVDILPLAPPAHARLQETPQRAEFLGQVPPL